MSEAFEVPSPHEEHVEHVTHHAHGKGDNFASKIAVMTAIMATVGALLSYQAGSTESEAAMDTPMSDTLTRLAEVLEERKGAAADSSYVASLYNKGLNKILEKVGEESVETIIAAKDAAISGDCSDVIYETADLWFHSMVMLAQLGQHPQAVLDELDRRFGLSGHAEKASRPSA